MEPYIKRKIFLRQGTTYNETEDYVASEKRLNISANGKFIMSLLCTPFMIPELVNGFFLTERISETNILPGEMTIDYNEEITVEINKAGLALSKIITTRCLGGFAFSKDTPFEKIHDMFSISSDDIEKLFEKFQKKSELFRLTGCFHSAALSDGEKILAFAEDIGRHNAVDKVMGSAVLQDITSVAKILLVSCRLSSEIVSKGSRWKIPVIASRAAPTDMAVRIAEECGITLVGFARGNRFNVYTNAHRLLLR